SQQYISVFGSYLGNQTLLPPAGPLPNSLGGFSASITDSAGRAQSAGVFALLPGQLNVLLPSNVATGAASLSIQRNGQTAATEQVFISDVVPTMFSTYLNGSNMALGQIVWLDNKGNQQQRPLIVPNGSQLQATALPFSESQGPVTVILYGTGLGSGKSIVAY